MLNRREFVIASMSTAGGLLLAIRLPAATRPRPYESDADGATEVSAWLAIEPDNTVIIRCAQAEMGEGVLTALPMLIAEELEADWAQVRVEYASANRNLRDNNVYGRMTTVGSHAVRGSRAALQTAGANARERLRAAAAQRWNVPIARTRAERSRIYDTQSDRSATYGELARAAAAITDVPKFALKTPQQFKLAGKPMQRVDVRAKVDGSAVFGIDVRLPGMLYAAVAHCPVFGGKVKSYDAEAVKSRRGVRHVLDIGSGIAVVADTYWQALTATRALSIEWDRGAGAGTSSAQWHREFHAALDTPGIIVREAGDVQNALAGAARRLKVDYYVPYLAHACMEPLNCTAHARADRVDLWLGTQSPDGLLAPIAQVAGVDPRNVYVHNCFLGGGFGRRSPPDFASEAVRISKAVGAPVQMIWSREEDMRMGRYRPMSHMRFEAALDAAGTPTAYVSHSVTPSIMASIPRPPAPGTVDSTSVDGLADIPYEIANQRISNVRKDTHLPAWFWRAVGKTQNVFALESFIDELATAAKADPLEFRTQLLKQKLTGYQRVLRMLKEKSQWDRPLPAGAGRGIAIHESVGSIVGQVAEVSVARDGVVKVSRIVSVVDCGNLVNPLTAEEQVESAVIWALTAAMYGKLTVEDGTVRETNFDRYPLLRIKDTPTIETYFSLSGGDIWGGIGEAAVGTVAPAVTNAIFSATGTRVRSLPLSDHDLSRSV
jgi:isoquinoline 1-oxidoreductase subunit beta